MSIQDVLFRSSFIGNLLGDQSVVGTNDQQVTLMQARYKQTQRIDGTDYTRAPGRELEFLLFLQLENV